jgi:predicted glycoside hydrolase/deacetylase ChbG (UPF0249 family)
VDGTRYLVVNADDYGIGPATSRAILELGKEQIITSSVLMANSPHAEQAIQAWHEAGRPLEMGWHPCLTMDRPVLPPHYVPSLVDCQGYFLPLPRLAWRLFKDAAIGLQIRAELRAQYQRCRELLGQPPVVINGHKHIHIFPIIGPVLLELVKQQRPLPYIRRVSETVPLLAKIPGARLKRAFLSCLGRGQARRQTHLGIPDNHCLAGVTDPRWVSDPQFLVRWIAQVPGQVVELACHPGYYDESLLGRDATPQDGQLQRRVRELELLRRPEFLKSCQRAGFRLVAPSALLGRGDPGRKHAA